MTGAEAARHHAHAMPGYELISYREVALPLFQVKCTLLMLEEKDLPPIQEYVLRTVELGVEGLEEVSGLLGLEPTLARAAAAELLHNDLLVLGASKDGARHQLQVTTRGRQAAKKASQVVPVEDEVPVWVDGLTREVISVTGKGVSRFLPRESRERGLVEIAAFPRTRPQLPEILFEKIKGVFNRETAGTRLRRQPIGLAGIGRSHRYAREGVALAFKAPGEEEPVVFLVVDGEISDTHGAAFAHSRQGSARRLAPADWTSAAEALAQDLPADLLQQAAPPEETERLESERQGALQERRQLEDQAETAGPDELAVLRQQLEAARAREQELRQALDNISVRQVPVYEHRDYLDRALTEASQRVLIISPWIRFEVVDSAFINRLRKLLDRGVELWVGYGIEKEGGYRAGWKGDRDREAEQALKRLAGQHERFHLNRLGDTHAKVLVCDSRFSIITSFNWLSFRGDTQLKFRDERGYYVGLRQKVDDVFESYAARFKQA